jgi:hypothetical protein
MGTKKKKNLLWGSFRVLIICIDILHFKLYFPGPDLDIQILRANRFFEAPSSKKLTLSMY